MMRKWFFGGAFLCVLAGTALSQRTTLPPAPDDLVEFLWSTQLAKHIYENCADYAFETETNPVVFDYVTQMMQDGIDVQHYGTAYASVPKITADNIVFLISQSSVAALAPPFQGDYCDIAYAVYKSDMLAGAMLRLIPISGEN